MNKLAKSMITTLVILLIAGALALVVVLNVKGDDKKSGSAQTLDDIVAYSYQTSDMTTDLQDGSFVRIQFQIVTDSKNAKEEVEKREFQLKNMLIKELANMDEEAFKSGLSDLEDHVKQKLNEVMTEGKVTDVYTISKILQ
ncbi:flagellar basal body-associated protein FliL [Virgibacillus dakarensis]|uniref:Flagellar protein FliL n=1 Tax=Lentibacillus populi TaxID=1827502 RepID=A0A9W5TUI5_9BACI|nr:MULTISPECIES: flagellar basal body-associated protein FliL [Bacillaceae]MBT2216667.1 flagellar basal body-associated protein FliL [Virgibacillus dakarensis]MTW86618.1 flagellar basal body-associated protein FliL [Virgibacillus dakarensis]GGB30356.1 flagellar protein FliL [Lentibacillus populi]